jgi:hypothetical protein
MTSAARSRLIVHAAPLGDRILAACRDRGLAERATQAAAKLRTTHPSDPAAVLRGHLRLEARSMLAEL